MRSCELHFVLWGKDQGGHMNYGALKNLDIANGPGCRVSLFVSGCRNHCKGCFQPETWDFNYGQEFTSETLQELLTMLENPHVAGLSILGGDPFESENQICVLGICKAVREKFPDGSKTIWMWTGYL
jgi:anaerobic ribonucleoside-triphosphate reductase activating protein